MLWLDDAGVSLRELNDIVTADYKNGEELFTTKRDFAITSLINQIHGHFSSRYKSNSIISGARIGKVQDNMKEIAPVAGAWKGLTVDFCNHKSFVDFYLSDVSLFVKHTGNITIKIFDLLQDKEVHSFTVAAVSGKIITVNVAQLFKSDRRKLSLFIGYLSTGITSYQVTAGTGGCVGCGSVNTYLHTPYLTAHGGSITNSSTKIDNNVAGAADTAGISLNYSLQCNHQDWLCTISNTLALPVLYKTAAEIAGFALLNSNRQNSSTIIDLERWEKRRDEYEFKYRESFDNVLKHIKLPSDNACYECKEMARHAIILP